MHVLAARMSRRTESLPFSVHLLGAAHAWCSCGVKGDFGQEFWKNASWDPPRDFYVLWW